LHDRGSSAQGRFSGTARFSPDGRGLLHIERGELVWPTHSGPAHRTLRYQPTLTPGVLDVYFADGRPFHRLDLREGRCAAVHPCGNDEYVGEFTVSSPDEWSYCWRVTGPEKDLLLSSVLRRKAE